MDLISGIQLFERQVSRTPCPINSPLQIGTSERYQVLCGVDLPGSDYMRFQAASLLGCVQICTSYGSSCVGVAYEASGAHGSKNCYLKSSLPQPTEQTFVMDSAIALPNDVLNDCETLPNRSQFGSTWYEKHCGLDFSGNNMQTPQHAKSLHDCIEQCEQTANCKGVSFEAAMTHGSQYDNCYLKSSADTSMLVQNDFDVDSALVVAPPVDSVAPVSTSVAPRPPTVVSSSMIPLPTTPVVTISEGVTSQGPMQTLIVTVPQSIPTTPTSPTTPSSSPAPSSASSSHALISKNLVLGLIFATMLQLALSAGGV